MSDQEINGDILRAYVGPDQRDTSRPSEVLLSLTSRYVGISKELLSGLTKRFMEIILELFFFNSVFHPTKSIPPRLLGETGVRKH